MARRVRAEGAFVFMREVSDSRTVLVRTLLVAACAAAVLLAGCRGSAEPITEQSIGSDATGTVNAPLPGSSSATSSATTTGSTSSTATLPSGFPAKAVKFAQSVGYTVWYPKGLPTGYALQALDIVELDPGTGLILDMTLLNGGKAVMFTQGSPKERSYPIDSVEKVPWGTATADVVRQDPADPSSKIIIVYSKDGNFAELQGDISNDALKAIAASMMPVK